jgi:DNA polymerase III subunit gamma/tau
MTYTALARKWRPRSFAEMSGQEHVLKALGNALDSGRVHHAFLFTGTRGVGKTTIARIFAKCLNCEQGVGARPCGACASCTEIDAGRFIDLIEVDAASRTKVDDTRELLDNVQYSPTRGRYKVYLIDEVHMLSTHSFNALLKTLEEPPPHVKFLLATTDPQKLPVTVLSRCLQFNLKRLSTTLIGARLAHILAQEGIEAEPAALRLVATAADGSLRDALSLLDQLLVFGNGVVREADASAMLGTVDRSHVAGLARLLAAGQPAALIEGARQLEQWSPDYAQLLDELASLLTQVAILQAVGGEAAEEAVFAPELLAELAGQMSAEDLQLYYQIAILGRRDLALHSDPRTGFQMTLLRMLAFRPAVLGSGPPPTAQAPAVTPTAATAGPVSGAASAAGHPAAAPAAAASGAATADLATLTPAAWPQVVQQLPVSGLTRNLATNLALLAVDGPLLKLVMDPKLLATRSPSAESRLVQALSQHYGRPLRLEIAASTDGAAAASPAALQARATEDRLAGAQVALEADPGVQAFQSRLGATLQAGSVRLERTDSTDASPEN